MYQNEFLNMKLGLAMFTLFFLLNTSLSFAQPRYAPNVRAARETQWMQDSLHLAPTEISKACNINLDFNEEMDKTIAITDTNVRNKKRRQLLYQKNVSMKAILSRDQYQKYLKREDEQERLERERAHNKGLHRPL